MVFGARAGHAVLPPRAWHVRASPLPVIPAVLGCGGWEGWVAKPGISSIALSMDETFARDIKSGGRRMHARPYSSGSGIGPACKRTPRAGTRTPATLTRSAASVSMSEVAFASLEKSISRYHRPARSNVFPSRHRHSPGSSRGVSEGRQICRWHGFLATL
jgi:hypothetical protein